MERRCRSETRDPMAVLCINADGNSASWSFNARWTHPGRPGFARALPTVNAETP